MKKALTILLCLILVLPLTSCFPEHDSGSETHSDETDRIVTNQETASWNSTEDWIQYEDVSIHISLEGQEEEPRTSAYDYFYRQSSGTLVRFNKITGEASTVCADPLCNHDDIECKLYTLPLLSTYSVCNGMIYYQRYLYKDGYEAEIWQYDLKNAVAKKLCSLYGLCYAMIAIESGCYFTDVSSVKDDENKPENTSVLYFADREGTVTKLATIKGSFNVNSVLNGKLIWDASGGSTYISDLYGREMAVLDTRTMRPVFGDYEYYMSPIGMQNGRMWASLIRKNQKTGEEEVLLKNCAQYTVLGNRIYYLEYLEEPIVLGSSPNGVNTYTDPYGGKLYSINLSGADKQLVLEDPTVHFQSLPSFRAGSLMDDRYLGIQLSTYKDVDGGIEPILVSGISMLIYDTQTGDYKVSTYEP